jgi:hypothetical protein
MVWIQQWQRLKMMHALALPGNITENMLHQWRTEYADISMFQTALVRLDHPWRIRIDLFLVETLLYEEIINQNKKGFVVPASSIPAMFINKWNLRPAPDAVRQVLQKLQANEKGYKNMWCRRFRHRWQLCVTEFLPRAPMDENERQFRVARPEFLH